MKLNYVNTFFSFLLWLISHMGKRIVIAHKTVVISPIWIRRGKEKWILVYRVIIHMAWANENFVEYYSVPF